MKKDKIRKLTKVGGGRTYSITIPIDVIRRKNWREHQKLIVEEIEGGILVYDWSKEKEGWK